MEHLLADHPLTANGVSGLCLAALILAWLGMLLVWSRRK